MLKSVKIGSVSYHAKTVLNCPFDGCQKNGLVDNVICYGFQNNGKQRYYCNTCGRTFNRHTNTFSARLRTSFNNVAKGVQSLCESIGYRGEERVENHSRKTVLDWVLKAGKQCAKFMQLMPVLNHQSFMQLDELHTFVISKDLKVYLWTCVDAVKKVLAGVHLSLSRSFDECKKFFHKFKERLTNVCGASTDGLIEYAQLMEKYYPKTPYAQVVKRYENNVLVEVTKKRVGKFTIEDVEQAVIELGVGRELNTSFIERLNATIRAHLACLNRKTLKFAKSFQTLEALVNIFHAYYNYALKHETLKTTPAVAAGIASKRLTLKEILSLRLI